MVFVSQVTIFAFHSIAFIIFAKLRENVRERLSYKHMTS